MTFFAVSAFPDPGFPAGTSIPNFGLSAPGAAGELLISLPLLDLVLGASWNGAPASVSVFVPNDPSLVGLDFYGQGLLRDANRRFGLTDAIEIRVGP